MANELHIECSRRILKPAHSPGAAVGLTHGCNNAQAEPLPIVLRPPLYRVILCNTASRWCSKTVWTLSHLDPHHDVVSPGECSWQDGNGFAIANPLRQAHCESRHGPNNSRTFVGRGRQRVRDRDPVVAMAERVLTRSHSLRDVWGRERQQVRDRDPVVAMAKRVLTRSH